MCDFVTRLNDENQDQKFYCTACAVGLEKFRLVRDCWYPGCMKHCPLFDCSCIPQTHSANTEETLQQTAQQMSCGLGLGEYKIIAHQPGKCAECTGSGLNLSPAKKLCARCEGTGCCAVCHGRFSRTKTELPEWKRPRSW